jgi:hypothetical protein
VRYFVECIRLALFPAALRQMAADFAEGYASYFAGTILGLRGRGRSASRRQDLPDYERPEAQHMDYLGPVRSGLRPEERALADGSDGVLRTLVVGMGDSPTTAFLFDLSDAASSGEAWDRVSVRFGIVHVLFAKWARGLGAHSVAHNRSAEIDLTPELANKSLRLLPAFAAYLARCPGFEGIARIASGNGLEGIFRFHADAFAATLPQQPDDTMRCTEGELSGSALDIRIVPFSNR